MPNGLLSSQPQTGLLNPLMDYQGLLGAMKASQGGRGIYAISDAAARREPMKNLQYGLQGLGMMPIPGVSDVAGLAGDAVMYAREPESRTPLNFGLSALGLLPGIPGMTVFHGSPHKFPSLENAPHGKFDLSKMGTGEGNQAQGWGTYVAQQPGVAGTYRGAAGWQPGAPLRYRLGDEIVEVTTPDEKQILHAAQTGDIEGLDARISQAVRESRSRYSSVSDPAKRHLELARKAKESIGRISVEQGHLYTVDLPDEHIEKMLDWDRPLTEQSESVKQALIDSGLWSGKTESKKFNGQAFYKNLTEQLGSKESASRFLDAMGIPGIKYYDAASMPKYYSGKLTDEGARNFVVFDPEIMQILSRE